MLRINDVHSIRLIAESAKLDLGAKIYCIAHYDNKDILTGGVIIMGDNGYSAEIHSASFRPTWGRQELLWAVFNYIFKFRGIKKLFGRVPEGNIRARKFNKHLGFKEETIIEDVFSGGEGCVVMSMYEYQCRFINVRPPHVEFASLDKISIVEVHEYSQSKVGA